MTILEAMRTSTRPGGVPAALQTEALAAALASRLWTVDGQPSETLTIGGSCGPVRCVLDISGSSAGARGDDLWTFEVIPASAIVEVLEANLRSVPTNAAEALDGLARARDQRIEELGLTLTGARWLPPPDDGSFELSYRSGNEEGSCALELMVETATETVREERASEC